MKDAQWLKHHPDKAASVTSACECTGIQPAKPEEGDDACVCRMMNVHPQKKHAKKLQKT